LTPFNPLQEIFLNRQEEAQELLTVLEDNAYELCADIKIFRDSLIELESMRAELSSLVS